MQNQLPQMLKPINASVVLPGSKSLCNRALLIAAMSNGATRLKNMLFSDDVLACLDVLKSLGCQLEIDQVERTVKCEGTGGIFPKQQAKLYCHEAGTLTRFILPICAAQTSGQYYVHASPRMMERPIIPVFKTLEKLGLTAEYHSDSGKLPATIHSKGLDSHGQILSMPSNESSQFLSAMLLASPLIQGGLSIRSEATHLQPYVVMTVKLMAQFGVEVAHDAGVYTTTPNQFYQATDYSVEPDVSTASYFWALAALTKGRVKVIYTGYDSMQGDIHFLNVLKSMGCQVLVEADGIVVEGSDRLNGVEINMRTFSDTFMTVVAVACFADSPTRITGIAHTRLQESDRVEAMRQGLQILGIYVETTEDSIYIDPARSNLRSGIVSGCNDHRIAMSLALLGVRQTGVVIEGAQCVSKTCPDYFERMHKLLS